MDDTSLHKITQLLRFYILTMTHKAGSGHPTSSFSAVELATVLFFKHLRADLDNLKNPSNDRVIFSKGHASALLYSLYAVAGKLTEEELTGYRTFDSPLEGHPTARFLFTEAATGSLGQGLSIGAGEAYARNSRVFVLLGDGELAEGSVWEAANWASYRKLSNLTAIVDVNRFGQAEETMYRHDVQTYARRFASFGWRTYVVSDGHDLGLVDKAFSMALEQSRAQEVPAAIIAKTIKGKGIAYWEDKPGWHNKMLPKEELEKAITEYGNVDKTIRGIICKP